MTEVASEKARRGRFREAFAEVLLDRAAWTFARLRDGQAHGVELHEETITQDLLLDIAKALPAMTVQTFSRTQEARHGADWQWEWWFHGLQWFGLRVQAKRLKTLRNRRLGYDLGYVTGRERNRQVDLLLEQAQADGVQAAYVLYNGPGLDLTQFDWGCRKLPESAAFFGVSILPGRVARDLVDNSTVDMASVSELARPWSCLAACDPYTGCYLGPSPWRHWLPDYADPDDRDFSVWAARNFFRMEMRARYRRDWTERQERSLNLRVNQYVRETPPGYLQYLLEDQGPPSEALPERVRMLTIFSTRANNAVS